MNEREELQALRRLAELEARAAKGLQQPGQTVGPPTPEQMIAASATVAPPPSTLDQRLTASIPGRVAHGARRPYDAAAQNIYRTLGDAASLVGLDDAAQSLRGDRKFLGMGFGAAATDKAIRRREEEYRAALTATGRTPGEFDAAELAGTVIGLAPLARVLPGGGTSLLRSAGAGAFGGGLAGVLDPVLDEEDQNNFRATKAAQVGLGALAGAVAGPVATKAIQGVKAIYNAVAPHVTAAIDTITGKGAERLAQSQIKAAEVITTALREIGQSIEDIPKAQYQKLVAVVTEAIASRKNLDPAALIRKSDFEAARVPHTLGQITRDPSQWAKEQNLRGVAGVGERIMEVLNAQTRAFQGKLDDISRGGGADVVKTGKAIGDVLRKMDDALGKRVSALYKTAEDSEGKLIDIPIGGLASDAARIIDDFGDRVPAAIVAKIKSYGMLGERQTKVFNYEEADKLIKVINSHAGGLEPATRNALRELRDAVKRAITDVDGEVVKRGAASANDVFAQGRSAASQRFKLHERVPALGDASTGTLNPDKFIQTYVVGAETKDSVRLAKLLQETSPEMFAAARAELGAIIKRAALGENPAGDAAMSPAALARVLRSLGPQKLKAWFGEEVAGELSTLSRVGGFALSVPGRAAVSTSNSNPMAMMQNYAGAIPGADRIKWLAALLKPIENQRAANTAVRAEVPRLASDSSVAERLARILAPQAAGTEASTGVVNRRRPTQR